MRDKRLYFLEGDPKVVLTEWIPLGADFIPQLLRKLRMPADPGGEGQSRYFITSAVDDAPNRALIEDSSAEVMLRVVEGRDATRVRLEAVVDIAETGAAGQEETVGIEIGHEGRIHYGMGLTGRLSLDDLARVLADLVDDTSQVMETLLNSYQREMLNVIFCNESRHRDKYVLVLADALVKADGTPCGLGHVLDDADCRSEVRQILGELSVEGSVELGGGEFVVAGENGMLLLSKRPDEAAEALKAHAVFSAMTTFLGNAFARVSSSWDNLRQQQFRIRARGIEEVMEIQTELSNLSADQGLLLSLPEQFRRDTALAKTWMEGMRVGDRVKELGLPVLGDLGALFYAFSERVDEARRAIRALGDGVENVRSLASSLSDREMYRINRAMNILTVVSVIILPLTLITGIYGMNFMRHTPEGPLISRLNMPELYWRYGYLVTLGVMALIAAALSLIFYRKGLLGREKPPKGLVR